MQVQNTQVRVTLPPQLQSFVKSKANKFGLSMSAYIKNLIIDDVKDMDFPEFKMSEKTEKVALQALQDHKQGKTKEIKNIDSFLEDL